MSTETVEFAGIELLSPCLHCSAPMAVNTLTDRCRCSSCLTESPLPASVWDEALRGVEKDVVQFATGYLRHGPEWGEGGPPPGPHVDWLRGHDAPPCPRCQRPMRLAPQGGCVCPACGAERAILPKPPWLAASSPVLGFVSDEPAAPEERPRAPVNVACTQCGGPLMADGSSRIVPCGYCAARVALPDAVWAALHPPRVKKRWWLVVYVAADPRREPADTKSFTRLAERALQVAMILALLVPIAGIIFAYERHLDPARAVVGSLLCIFSVPLAMWLHGRWLHSRICRPEHEVVGRIAGDPSAVEVLLTPPGQPAVILARQGLKSSNELRKRLAELGGENGKIRAWVIPKKTKKLHIELVPSVLE